MMAAGNLLEWLKQGRTVLGDGAMGTMLYAAGLPSGTAPEVWNVDEPAKVAAVYRGYLDAGAKIIETNTFGANGARLRANGVEGRTFELNRAAALLAREAVGAGESLVAGSVGPTGELMEPVGPLTEAEAQAIFIEQVRGLVDGGVDIIVIETMSDLSEVKAALNGVRQVAPEMVVAATMTFDKRARTMMGVTPRQAIETINGWGVRIIGANCGTGPNEIAAVMEQMAAVRPSGVYLMAQSNAGLPILVDGGLRFDGTPAMMAEYALRMRQLGVQIIGGCCGSTPAHIAAMHAALTQMEAIS